ncbi:LacI family DNA-binding transcriptional regulator [Phytoactinopolyspora mesophila]|uniref:Substrate-binding domain-containing protein n=1 Tax=Phytoactinopolyspora mesophila TaxID=2650750 RepID=A0A7K3MB09_9ACTN|nr:LacI family DNA-binding transcriptional regulator [Phytoactinopolyspora mesophila]NDL60505.1 substrate-binding domain-containing protein [Phytoactinopolyspora mesophila]
MAQDTYDGSVAPASPVRRATIKDVAEAAGVSRSTASRALTGRGYVAEGVRSRVLKAAKKLRYVPDATARHLKQQVSLSIGVLVSDLRNSFYAELAAGAGEASRAHGYSMMLADDGGLVDDEASAAEAFVALRVAGVVVTPVSRAVSDYLRRHGIPVVEVDRQFAPEECDAVVVDNRAAARRVTEQLTELGHRRIALFIDETDWTTGHDRYRGYREALDAAGIEEDPSLVVSSGWDVETAYNAALRLLGTEDRPTAVFAANNVLAEGVWRAAAKVKLGIPADLSVVSFDDAPWMSMVEPGVTAVAQDASALGRVAVERLMRRIADPADAPVADVIPVEIIQRGSTAPPRERG